MQASFFGLRGKREGEKGVGWGDVKIQFFFSSPGKLKLEEVRIPLSRRCCTCTYKANLLSLYIHNKYQVIEVANQPRFPCFYYLKTMGSFCLSLTPSLPPSPPSAPLLHSSFPPSHTPQDKKNSHSILHNSCIDPTIPRSQRQIPLIWFR